MFGVRCRGMCPMCGARFGWSIANHVPPSRPGRRRRSPRPALPRRPGVLPLPRSGRGPGAGDLRARPVATALPARRRRPRLPPPGASQHLREPAAQRPSKTRLRGRSRARPDRRPGRSRPAGRGGVASRVRGHRRARARLPRRDRRRRRRRPALPRSRARTGRARSHGHDPPLQGAAARRRDAASRERSLGKVLDARRVLVLVARALAPRMRGLDVKRRNILAALGTAAVAAGLGATAVPAQAAVTSATISGPIVTLNLDGADDNVTVSVANGLLVHGQTTGGLNSGSDWNSAMGGAQSVPADGASKVVVNGGGGNDAITVLAKNTEVAGVTLNGEGGDDLLTGADSNDLLNGGE